MTLREDAKWLLKLPVRFAVWLAHYLRWWVVSILGFGPPERQATAAVLAIDVIFAVLLMGAILVFIPTPFNILLLIFIGIMTLAGLRKHSESADRLWRTITLQGGSS